MTTEQESILYLLLNLPDDQRRLLLDIIRSKGKVELTRYSCRTVEQLYISVQVIIPDCF